MPRSDLIAAVATPPGKGGIGIVRASGDSVRPLAAALSIGVLPPPRHATYCRFVDAGGEVIDNGLALYFPAPHSFTGEEVLELQAHGGVWVMQQLLTRCLHLGARHAEAGEFTLRAYLNDKLDLAQAEALADLINADSAAAARAATRSLCGVFSAEVSDFTGRLRRLRRDLESDLDFSDDDTGAPNAETAIATIEAAETALTALITQAKQGALVTGGIDAVIIGAPNVGKSSLLNRLAGENAAIVTAQPGTTRDFVERSVITAGLAMRFCDSAGLRATEDEAEQEGVARSRRRAAQADLVLSVFTADTPPVTVATMAQTVLIHNKIDLNGQAPGQREGVVYLSAKTGAGIDDLSAALLKTLGRDNAIPPFSARARHLAALETTLTYLYKAKTDMTTPELAAAWLRDASQSLDGITCVYDDEALLGDIFSAFCIGK